MNMFAALSVSTQAIAAAMVIAGIGLVAVFFALPRRAGADDALEDFVLLGELPEMPADDDTHGTRSERSVVGVTLPELAAVAVVLAETPELSVEPEPEPEPEQVERAEVAEDPTTSDSVQDPSSLRWYPLRRNMSLFDDAVVAEALRNIANGTGQLENFAGEGSEQDPSSLLWYPLHLTEQAEATSESTELTEQEDEDGYVTSEPHSELATSEPVTEQDPQDADVDTGGAEISAVPADPEDITSESGEPDEEDELELTEHTPPAPPRKLGFFARRKLKKAAARAEREAQAQADRNARNTYEGGTDSDSLAVVAAAAEADDMEEFATGMRFSAPPADNSDDDSFEPAEPPQDSDEPTLVITDTFQLVSALEHVTEKHSDEPVMVLTDATDTSVEPDEGAEGEAAEQALPAPPRKLGFFARRKLKKAAARAEREARAEADRDARITDEVGTEPVAVVVAVAEPVEAPLSEFDERDNSEAELTDTDSGAGEAAAIEEDVEQNQRNFKLSERASRESQRVAKRAKKEHAPVVVVAEPEPDHLSVNYEDLGLPEPVTAAADAPPRPWF